MIHAVPKDVSVAPSVIRVESIAGLALKMVVAIIAVLSIGEARACEYKEASTVVDGHVATFGFYDCSSMGGGWSGGGTGSGGVGGNPEIGQPGGGSGSGSEGPPAIPCPVLVMMKPASCPNPIPVPNTADHGGPFAGGSGLAKLLYLKNHSGLLKPNEVQKLDTELFIHTVHASHSTSRMDYASMELIVGVARTCEMIIAQDPAPGRLAISKCHDVVEKLAQEAGGKSFAEHFKGWLDLNAFNIGIGRFDLEVIVSAFAPENSLSAKWKQTQADAACADWWQAAEQNKCSVP